MNIINYINDTGFQLTATEKKNGKFRKTERCPGTGK